MNVLIYANDNIIVKLEECAGFAQCFHFQNYSHIARIFDESDVNFLFFMFTDIVYFGISEPITPRKCNFG